MGRVGKMLNALRRDCWGCDNRIGKHRTPCTCQPTKTARQKEKRQWKRDVKDGNA
jgi:hypothetical protein